MHTWCSSLFLYVISDKMGSNKLVTVRHVDVWMEGRYAIICSVFEGRIITLHFSRKGELFKKMINSVVICRPVNNIDVSLGYQFCKNITFILYIIYNVRYNNTSYCCGIFIHQLKNYNLDRKLKTQIWSLWKHKIKTQISVYCIQHYCK
jgi:hypothetical protein